MNEIPQKNEEILVAEWLPEKEFKCRWPLYDHLFNWWNERYPEELSAFHDSETWDNARFLSLTSQENWNAYQMYNCIFDWLNDKFPYKMLEYMNCPLGHDYYCMLVGL